MAIGLGANLGDRLASLRAASDRVASLGEVLARSRVFETAPIGPPQPDYLNAALLLATGRAPEALLGELLAIECGMGRVRKEGEKWGPRVIDLDILWIEGVSVASDQLTVPHPHLLERAFALGPLLDVAPDARDPQTGRRYADVAFHRASLRLHADDW